MNGNAKCKNSRFEPPFGGLNVYLWLDGKRIADFLLLLVIIVELLSLALTREAVLSKHFRGNGASPPTIVGVRNWLSGGVVCVILRLAVLAQYRRVTDRQTDGRTYDNG